MGKQDPAELKSHEKKLAPETPLMASQEMEQTPGQLGSPGPLLGGESVESQSAALKKLPTAQQQSMVGRIGRAQGNHYVQKVVAASRSQGNRSGPSVQTKLTVSEPGDLQEQEADQVAAQVMKMPAPATPPQPPGDEQGNVPGIQRLSILNRYLQRFSLQRVADGVGGTDVDDGMQSRIEGMSRGGQPLPQSEREFFEPRMGVDLGDVRVHADGEAAETSQDLNARAYTVGSHVAFNNGEYQPGTSAGRQLLAHELTHVVQQGGAGQLQPQRQAKLNRCASLDCMGQSGLMKASLQRQVAEPAAPSTLTAPPLPAKTNRCANAECMSQMEAMKPRSQPAAKDRGEVKGQPSSEEPQVKTPSALQEPAGKIAEAAAVLDKAPAPAIEPATAPAPTAKQAPITTPPAAEKAAAPAAAQTAAPAPAAPVQDALATPEGESAQPAPEKAAGPAPESVVGAPTPELQDGGQPLASAWEAQQAVVESAGSPAVADGSGLDAWEAAKAHAMEAKAATQATAAALASGGAAMPQAPALPEAGEPAAAPPEAAMAEPVASGKPAAEQAAVAGTKSTAPAPAAGTKPASEAPQAGQTTVAPPEAAAPETAATGKPAAEQAAVAETKSAAPTSTPETKSAVETPKTEAAPAPSTPATETTESSAAPAAENKESPAAPAADEGQQTTADGSGEDIHVQRLGLEDLVPDWAKSLLNTLRGDADEKKGELRDEGNEKGGDINGEAQSKGNELEAAGTNKSGEIKNDGEVKSTELTGQGKTKTDELKGDAAEKEEEVNANGETKSEELAQAQQTKGDELDADAQKTESELGTAATEKQTEVETAAQQKGDELESEATGKVEELDAGAQAKTQELEGQWDVTQEEGTALETNLESEAETKTTELETEAGNADLQVQTRWTELQTEASGMLTELDARAGELCTLCQTKVSDFMATSVDPFIDNVQDSWQQIQDNVKTLWKDFMEWAKPGLDWLGKQWQTFSSWVNETIWAPLKEKAGEVAAWVGEKVSAAWDWAKGAWGKLQQAWNSAKEWLANGGENARKWINEKANAARTWVAGKAEAARTWINGKADAATAWIGGKADAARTWIGGKADAARSWIGGKADQALAWINGKSDAVRSWIGEKANAARTWITGKSTAAQAWMQQAATAGVNWFSNTGHAAVSGLSGLARNAASAISSRGGAIGRWFGGIINGLVGGVESAGNWAVDFASKALDKGLKLVNGMATRAIQTVEKMGTMATTLVEKASTTAVNLGQQVSTAAVNGLRTAGNGAVTLVGNAATNAVSLIESGATGAVNLVRNASVNAVNLLEGAATRAITWVEGKAIGAGNAIESTIKTLIDLAKNAWQVVSAGWDQLKSWLGTAFSWIGEKVGQIAGWLNENVIQPATQWLQEQWENLKESFKAAFPGLVACWEAFTTITGQIWEQINRLPIIKDIIYIRGEIIKGAILGDFVENPNIWNIIGQVAIGFVPYAGQVADIRDLIAAIKKIAEGDTSAWFDLCLGIIGIIPGIGDLVKAGGKHLDEVADGVKGAVNWFSSADEILGPMVKSLGPELIEELGPDLIKRLGPELLEELGPDLLRKLGPELLDELGPDLLRKLGPELLNKLNPDAIRLMAKYADNLSDADISVLLTYGDEAVDLLTHYGDDLFKSLSPEQIGDFLSWKKGLTPETQQFFANNPGLWRTYANMDPDVRNVLTLCNSPCIPKWATELQGDEIQALLAKTGLPSDHPGLKQLFHNAESLEDLDALITHINELGAKLDTVTLDSLLINPNAFDVVRRNPELADIIARQGENAVVALEKLGDGGVDVLRQYDGISHIPGADGILKDLASGDTTTLGAIGEINYIERLVNDGVEIDRVGDWINGKKAGDIILKDGTIIDVKNYDWSRSFYQTDFGQQSAINEMLRQINLRKAQYPGQAIQYTFTSPLEDVPEAIVTALQDAGVTVGGS